MKNTLFQNLFLSLDHFDIQVIKQSCIYKIMTTSVVPLPSCLT